MPDERPRPVSDLLLEAAERDGFKVEWLSGKIVMQAPASAFHALIVTETIRQFPADQWWGLAHQGVGTPGVHRGPQPDIVLVPSGALREDENPIRSELATAVFEVVSDDTRAEDIIDKPNAHEKIPVYVIIDRHERIVRVCSEPEGGEYTRQAASPFGKSFNVPEPAGFTIETAQYP